VVPAKEEARPAIDKGGGIDNTESTIKHPEGLFDTAGIDTKLAQWLKL
jgi:hypothetical protein